MVDEIKHYQINGKYKIQFERVGSANRTDGFKCEVNSDSDTEAIGKALELYQWGIKQVEANKPQVIEPKK